MLVFLIVIVLVLCSSLRFVVHVCIFNRHGFGFMYSLRVLSHACIFNRHGFGFMYFNARCETCFVFFVVFSS